MIFLSRNALEDDFSCFVKRDNILPRKYYNNSDRKMKEEELGSLM